MTIDAAVVPVAGRGLRLLPLTKAQPKELLPLGQKPVVQYVAEELQQVGVRRLCFVTGPGKAAIENHFDRDDALISHLREKSDKRDREELLAKLDFERMGLEYIYTRQGRQLGLGHAVLCARSVIMDDPFVIALGDSVIGLRQRSQVVGEMIGLFEREHPEGIIAFETVPADQVVHYGIAAIARQRAGHFELSGLVEKPSPDAAPSDLAVAGRYVFSARIFDYLERTEAGVGQEIQLTDAVAAMIADGGRVLGVPLPAGERRYDVGNFASYFRAFFDFAEADEEGGLRQYIATRDVRSRS
jgi:UTP--glucose-1-phosphate uridylyltransferase